MLQIGKRWMLQCSQCGYSVDVESDEINDVRMLNAKARDYENGKIPVEDFKSLLADSRLACLAPFSEYSDRYDCASCGEDVPRSFECCWNCGHQNDNVVVESDRHTAVIPCVDDPIFGARNLIEVDIPRGGLDSQDASSE